MQVGCVSRIGFVGRQLSRQLDMGTSLRCFAFGAKTAVGREVSLLAYNVSRLHGRHDISNITQRRQKAKRW